LYGPSLDQDAMARHQTGNFYVPASLKKRKFSKNIAINFFEEMIKYYNKKIALNNHR